MVEKLLRALCALAIVLAATSAAQADMLAKSVAYTVDDQSYQGYFVRNTALGDHQPVVLIIHDWNGLDRYEKRRARMLARQGYAAFVADLYGQGVRPETLAEKKARSGALVQDRAELLRRLQGAVAQLSALPGVNADQVVAIGYCFGGTAVLELARSGAPLQGFVTFHAGIAMPKADFSRVRAPLLILQGSDDAAAPMSRIATLATTLNAAGVDYRMEIYGGVPHAFTVWSGKRYRPEADLASWRELMTFLGERLPRHAP